MAINKNVFIHEIDKAALQTLKSIPGLARIVQVFMKVGFEKLMYIENTATNVKLSQEQLPQYYNMLPPICDKLGIEVPDLFLKLDVTANAYTSGDTKPFIVITSGLIETFPEKLIPTVLAHECGHIACRHVLYSTIGRLILNGALKFLPLNIGNIATLPIGSAFAYWMRCSELSADRAAALCDGHVDGVIETCARLAGFDKDIPYEMNLEAFMAQAVEYKEYVGNNALNKTMEFIMFGNNSHPINAVRAYEIKKWEESEDFIKSKQFFDSYNKDEKPTMFPLSWTEKNFLGRDYKEVEKELLDFGFYDVELIRETEKSLFTKIGSATNVSINGSNKFKDGDWVVADSIVEVRYCSPLTEEEIAALHLGEIKIPNNPNYYIGKDYKKVEAELSELGFGNIFVDEIRDITKDKDRRIGKIARITIDKSPIFSKGDWIDTNALIELSYHALKRR